MNSTPPAQDRMFFIVGRGRSGTTLLKRILNAHPEISVAPEGLFIMNLYRSYRWGNWSPERIARFIDHLFLEDAMRRWPVTAEDLDRRWKARTDTPTFAALCADIHEAHAEVQGNKTDGRLLGSKNPHHTLAARELLEMFPQAKFIHVVRDYRDNVLSYQHVPFDLSNAAALAYRWTKYHELALHAAKRDPERFHEVRFEDLVSSPKSTVEALCRFLGIQVNESMLKPYETNESSTAWHRHLSGPIDPDLAGRWQSSLSPKEIAIIDRICQPLGHRFGYEPTTSSPWTWSLIAGYALGSIVTAIERLVFRLPISVQALIIGIYRRITRSRAQ